MRMHVNLVSISFLFMIVVNNYFSSVDGRKKKCSGTEVKYVLVVNRIPEHTPANYIGGPYILKGHQKSFDDKTTPLLVKGAKNAKQYGEELAKSYPLFGGNKWNKENFRGIKFNLERSVSATVAFKKGLKGEEFDEKTKMNNGHLNYTATNNEISSMTFFNENEYEKFMDPTECLGYYKKVNEIKCPTNIANTYPQIAAKLMILLPYDSITRHHVWLLGEMLYAMKESGKQFIKRTLGNWPLDQEEKLRKLGEEYLFTAGKDKTIQKLAVGFLLDKVSLHVQNIAQSKTIFDTISSTRNHMMIVYMAPPMVLAALLGVFSENEHFKTADKAYPQYGASFILELHMSWKVEWTIKAKYRNFVYGNFQEVTLPGYKGKEIKSSEFRDILKDIRVSKSELNDLCKVEKNDPERANLLELYAKKPKTTKRKKPKSQKRSLRI